MESDFTLGLTLNSIKKPLGQILVNAGLIDKDNLEDILSLQRRVEKYDLNNRALGEMIAEKYAIPRFVIESLFIREQLLESIKGMFSGFLAMDDMIDEDMIMGLTGISLKSWEAEVSEIVTYIESMEKGATASRRMELDYVKGTARFDIDFHGGISVDVPFSYKNHAAMTIDIETAYESIRYDLVSD